MNRILLITALAISSLISNRAEARILNVPDDFEFIQNAIDMSEEDDTILVAPGRYEETVAITGVGIVVAGRFLLEPDNPELIGETIIDGGGGERSSVFAMRALEGEEMELAGLTIIGGDTDYGGGIYCSDVTVYLHDLIIEGNYADRWGGGIYATDRSRLTGQNLVIRGNEAGFRGGGFGCNDFSNATMEDCLITGNSSPFGGGIGILNGSGLTMRGSTVSDNTATEEPGPGGIFITGGSPLDLVNCRIINNRSNGISGIKSHLTRVNLDHVLIAGNQGGYVIDHSSDRLDEAFHMTNVTFTDNIATDNYHIRLAGGGSTITNTILRGSYDDESLINCARVIALSYSNIEGMEEAFSGGAEHQWGGGIFDEDPLYIDSGRGDFRLQPNSPCIDAGDPDSEPDPDGSRRDIGAYGTSPYLAWTSGRVTDLETGEELAGAAIRIEKEGGLWYGAATGDDGLWSRYIPIEEDSSQLVVRVTLPPYVEWSGEGVIHPGDSLSFESSLAAGRLAAPEEIVELYVRAGATIVWPIELRNTGNALFAWEAVWEGLGVMGGSPGEVVQSADVGRIVSSDRVQGVAFDGENYFVSASVPPGPNMIFVLDREFRPIDAFAQPGSSRYGVKDLAWDGDYLWMPDDSLIYAVTRAGEVVKRLRSPVLPTNNITMDTDNQVLYISSTVGNIFALDTMGQIVDTIPRFGSLRNYGLAWDSNREDEYKLLALLTISNSPTNILFGLNIATGDTLRLATLDGVGCLGLSLMPPDPTTGQVRALTVRNLVADAGGDRIEEFILRENLEWFQIEPQSGAIEPGERTVIRATIQTTGRAAEWAFPEGVYEAGLTVTHTGHVGEWNGIIRINVDGNGVPSLPQKGPESLAIMRIWPNPFNSAARVAFSLTLSGMTELSLIDITGREVESVELGRMESGAHEITIEAAELPSGVYLLRLGQDGRFAGRKVVVIR